MNQLARPAWKPRIADGSESIVQSDKGFVGGGDSLVKFDLLLAYGVLSVHLAFILWILLGWLITPRRPVLRWLHIGSVGYGIFIEASNLTCPLTFLEQALEARAGIAPYHQPFILHYLELLIYPDIPPRLLIVGAVAVCVGILGIYVFRSRRG